MPRTPKHRPASSRDPSADMTDAELDALVAERMKCLPPWWDTAAKVQAARASGKRRKRKRTTNQRSQ